MNMGIIKKTKHDFVFNNVWTIGGHILRQTKETFLLI